MRPDVWIPGVAGPQDDFVNRLHRKIDRYVERRGNEQAVVEVELADGSNFALHSISPEPGYGFVTLTPYPEDEERPWPQAGGEEPVPPDEVVVPVGMIRKITLNDAPERRGRLGFAVPEQEAPPAPS